MSRDPPFLAAADGLLFCVTLTFAPLFRAEVDAVWGRVNVVVSASLDGVGSFSNGTTDPCGKCCSCGGKKKKVINIVLDKFGFTTHSQISEPI